MVKLYNAYNGVRVDKIIKSGRTKHFLTEMDAIYYAELKRSYSYPITDEKGNLTWGVPK